MGKCESNENYCSLCYQSCVCVSQIKPDFEFVQDVMPVLVIFKLDEHLINSKVAFSTTRTNNIVTVIPADNT